MNLFELYLLMGCDDKEHLEVYNKRLNAIKLFLAPPTAEEICEALSKYFGRKWEYIKPVFQTVDSPYESIEIINGLFIAPPRLSLNLVSLLSRFYEGVDND